MHKHILTHTNTHTHTPVLQQPNNPDQSMRSAGGTGCCCSPGLFLRLCLRLSFVHVRRRCGRRGRSLVLDVRWRELVRLDCELVVGRRWLQVDGVVLRRHVGLQAVPRLPQVVFTVLSGQAPREGDEVYVSVLVDLLHLLPLYSHFPEAVAHPAQGRGEQNEQGNAQEVEDDV